MNKSVSYTKDENILIHAENKNMIGQTKKLIT